MLNLHLLIMLAISFCREVEPLKKSILQFVESYLHKEVHEGIHLQGHVHAYIYTHIYTLIATYNLSSCRIVELVVAEEVLASC